ncbi:hypothetical protein L596_012922 [Steinernema carpocapsae]|uniref:Uncharacterized protein n=1 Tax=Steinernema carpocapsae TaxID=34508 RepID=A0A4U5NZA8_STECR|nr:hypothetical protein L596_012922 [Steinernema carpocapsae]
MLQEFCALKEVAKSPRPSIPIQRTVSTTVSQTVKKCGSSQQTRGSWDFHRYKNSDKLEFFQQLSGYYTDHFNNVKENLSLLINASLKMFKISKLKKEFQSN